MQLRKMPQWMQRYFIRSILRHNNGNTYQIIKTKDNREFIRCFTCRRDSYSMGDVSNKFCLLCGYHEENARQLYVPARNQYNG